MKRAIEFIEKNLLTPFSLDDVAAAEGLSTYHLHRVFTATFGHSIKTYVRKRRLTEAARLLRTTTRGVLDIALECQFESQASFTRAFRALFNQPPASFRREGPAHWYAGMEAATPKSLRHLKVGLTHELRELPSLSVRGVPQTVDLDFEDDVMALWLELARDVEAPLDVYGVGLGALGEHYVYLAGVDAAHAWPFTMKPERTIELHGAYAVFTHRGELELLRATVDFIWATWLPRSGFNKSARPDFERFSLPEIGSDDAEIQLWVSVDSR